MILCPVAEARNYTQYKVYDLRLGQERRQMVMGFEGRQDVVVNLNGSWEEDPGWQSKRLELQILDLWRRQWEQSSRF